MFYGVGTITADLWGRLFPERQIYLRSRGQMRYVTLGSAAQFMLCTLLLLLFMWTSFASVTLAYQFGAIARRDARIDALRISHRQLDSELADLRRRVAIASPLTSSTMIARHESAVDAVRPQADSEMAQLTEIVKSFAQPRTRPQRLDDIEAARITITPRERPKHVAFTLPQHMTIVGDGLRHAQTPSFPKMPDVTSAGAAGERNDVVAYLASDASTTVAALEKLIRQTGLDADAILRRRDSAVANGPHAKGGPLLSVPPAMQGKFLRRNSIDALATPITRMGRLEMLREALFSLPLAEPVEKYYVSSGYGYRRDPFTHEKAFHSGVDMVAPRGDQILASAPGTVVFAGRNGPYGNMVEIDHGHGVKSRYGHMSKISVVRGQKVGLRDLIGLVGSTGRSGTAHLHFEVWFDGKPRDPRNFLKAGENVFQRQG